MNSMQLLGVKYTVWIACNHYKVLNTHSVNSMQSLQGVKYTVWIACNHYKVFDTLNSMQACM